MKEADRIGGDLRGASGEVDTSALKSGLLTCQLPDYLRLWGVGSADVSVWRQVLESELTGPRSRVGWRLGFRDGEAIVHFPGQQ